MYTKSIAPDGIKIMLSMGKTDIVCVIGQVKIFLTELFLNRKFTLFHKSFLLSKEKISKTFIQR